MEVLEINNISVSNQNISDELNIKDGDTKYAKSKRGSKALSVAIVTVTVGSALALGASVLNISNVFITDPTISQIDEVEMFVVEGTTLNYSFEIKNPRNLKVTFCIDKEKEKVFTLDVSISDKYQGQVEGLEYNVNYKAYFHITNGLDYFKDINEYSFTIE